MPEPLRIGLLCDDRRPRRWEAECLRKVLAVPGVEICVVAIRRPEPAAVGGGLMHLMRYPWRLALFLQYRRRLRVPANEPADRPYAVTGAPTIHISPVRKGVAELIPDEDLERLRAHRPDVLLRFGFGILHGAILELPRYGVWSHHHGDPQRYRGQPPGFWELHDGQRVIGAVLQRLTGRLDAGHALYTGWFATDPGSLANTLNNVLEGTTGWMAAICRRLVNGDATAAVGQAIATDAPVRRYPDNGAFLRFMARMRAARATRVPPHDQREWNMGVIYHPIGALLDDKPNLNPRWLPPPSPGSSRSSPSGYMLDGQLNVLYTKRDLVTGNTEVSRLRPKRDNVLKRSRAMLPAEAGCSHPCVVQLGQDIWVVAHAARSGRTDLFKLGATNDALEFHATLLPHPLGSPTLFQHAGRWWLMGTRDERGDHELHAYHAEHIAGPYHAHAQEPLLTDARNACPAGTPFVRDGVLYRPASDRTTPDAQVVILRVDELTPETFRQSRVKVLTAIKGSIWSGGIGSIAAVDGLTLVEGSRGRSLTSAQDRGQSRRRKGRTNDRDIEKDDQDDT